MSFIPGGTSRLYLEEPPDPEFCLMYEEEEIIDGADQKAIYDEMKWDE